MAVLTVTARDQPTFGEWLAGGGTVILDGGFATRAEHYGVDLDHPLWASRVLIEAPQIARRIHLDFLGAGADCIATGTYQASYEGLTRLGLEREQAAALFERGVEIAKSARDELASSLPAGRLRPWVAASIGPFGAFLADGSEYRGDYDAGPTRLRDFHCERLRTLIEAGPDVLAIETVPSGIEAEILVGLLDRLEVPVPVWISFSCSDESHLADGTALADLVCRIEHPGVVAWGVNCVPPQRVSGLLRALRAATDKPLAAYPNSGERYDTARRGWRGDSTQWIELALEWRELGAQLIGGCCRSTPEDIADLREVLLESDR